MALTVSDDGDDPVIAALTSLLAIIKQQRTLARQALERGAQMHEQRREGRSHREIGRDEDATALVETVTRMVDTLVEANSQFRLALVRALHDEGVSMGEIGRLFGVTRQRVSFLLASSPMSDDPTRSSPARRRRRGGGRGSARR